MDGKDLLKDLETVYVLPNDELTFVTSREFSPDVAKYFMSALEEVFPDQRVHLISGVHKVLIRREPFTSPEGYEKAKSETEAEPNYDDIPDLGRVTGYYEMVAVEAGPEKFDAERDTPLVELFNPSAPNDPSVAEAEDTKEIKNIVAAPHLKEYPK